MTASPPLETPRPLRMAVMFAFGSMALSLVQAVMLLLSRALFTVDKTNEAWRSEGEDFSSIVIAGMVVSTIVAMLLAISAVLTMTLGSQAGRVLLFVTSGLAIAWNLGCSCILSFAWISGMSLDRNAGAEHYLSWQFTSAVLLGFAAGIAAVVTVVLLAQKSVTRYYRELRGY